MPKIDDLVHAPFPLPDPELVRENLWITQNGKDYRIAPTRLGYVQQTAEEPIDPFNNQLWWDTSRAARALKTSAFLKVWQRNRWHGVGPILDQDGNGTIPGMLDVVGGVISGKSSDGYLQITSNLQINGGTIAGPLPAFGLRAMGDLNVLGNLSTGLLTVNGNGIVTGNFTVNGVLTAGTLQSTGDATIGGDLTVTGSATIDTDLTVNGAFTAFQVTSTGGANIGGNAAIGGSTTIGGTLAVTNATTLSGTLAVTGATTLGSTLAVTGATAIGGTLNVTGAASFAGGLSATTASISGNETVGGTLGVTGAATFGSSLTTGGTLTTGGPLTVNGATNSVVNGGLVVNPQAGQTVAALFNAGIQVNGDIAFLGSLRASPGRTGGISTADSLTVNATPGLAVALAVNGQLQLNGDIAITGRFLNPLNLSGGLVVNGFAQLNAGLQVQGVAPGSTNSLNVIGSANFTGDVSSGAGLRCAGNCIIGGTGISTSGFSILNPIANSTIGLTVSGSIVATGPVFAAGVQLTSDRRLKADVTGYDRGLAAIARLKPVGYRLRSAGDAQFYGLIADEVEAVMPEAVGEQDGTKTVDLMALIVALINTTRELGEQVEDLRHEINRRD